MSPGRSVNSCAYAKAARSSSPISAVAGSRISAISEGEKPIFALICSWACVQYPERFSIETRRMIRSFSFASISSGCCTAATNGPITARIAGLWARAL